MHYVLYKNVLYLIIIGSVVGMFIGSNVSRVNSWNKSRIKNHLSFNNTDTNIISEVIF